MDKSLNIIELYKRCSCVVGPENVELHQAHLTIIKDQILQRLGHTVSDGGGTGTGAALLREIYYRQVKEGELGAKQAMQRLERDLKELSETVAGAMS